MFPGMNPRQMQKAMQKLGIKQEEIDAVEVIIKTHDKKLIIKKPQVIKVNLMGQDTLQVTGDIEEETLISEEDVNTVAEQTGKSKEVARKVLEECDGDLAEAIMKLQK